MADYILWFDQLGMDDVGVVGGKNASLGEMISNLTGKGVSVPNGFATTTSAYQDFLSHDGLAERINAMLATLNVDDIAALTKAGATIRGWLMDAPLPEPLLEAIEAGYHKLAAGSGDDASFAVRSSATAEDLPDASFAGQQETFLNVRGLDQVIAAIKEVFASLYNDR
ncbi:MAG: phosphoenolpyruvate synthase, partial [Thiothrix sp.]|nr:phosphoenolpyruvate synthase [Thiothrix sp.]